MRDNRSIPTVQSSAFAASAARAACELAVCLLIAVLIARTWLLESFAIQSGSMAPTLRGTHRLVTCADCGFRFACGSDASDGPLPPDALAACPNCGFARNALGPLADARGDRLLVSRAALAWRSPRRWEIAVFRRAGASDRVLVKRVVGLPGESVQIRRGNVYIDGRLARKSLDQQRAVAVLVHDSRFRPQQTPDLPSRWQPRSADTRWRSFPHGWARSGEAPKKNDPAGPPADWLAYGHWRRSGDRATVVPASIEDRYGYNQLRPVEESWPVSELLVAGWIRTWGPGRVWLSIADDRDRFVAELTPATGGAVLWRNASRLRQVHGQGAVFERATYVELSLIDRQFLLALDGKLLLGPIAYGDDEADGSKGESLGDLAASTDTSPAIAAQGLAVAVTDLKVFRDIYYTHPRGRGDRGGLDHPIVLGADEYYVLGDNSPISDDSRFWSEGAAVPGVMLIGRPLVVHLPSRVVNWGFGPLEVLDVSRVRAIR